MSIPVSHFVEYSVKIDFVEFEKRMEAFAACGGKYFVAGCDFMRHALKEPDTAEKSLKAMLAHGLRFKGAHSFWGQEWDLNQLNPELHPKVIANQKKIIDIASEIQADLLVIHPGDAQFITGNPDVLQMREQCIRTLEELLPYAEKQGVRISLENIIAPSDTAVENLAILEHFKSPSLVCCYDTGHANVMEDAPGKDKGKVHEYIRKSLWHEELRLAPKDSTLELLKPYIVTAHVHDNSGYGDEHKLPGEGIIDWKALVPRLLGCPRLEFIQDESSWERDGHSIPEIVQCFDKLFP